MLHLIKKEKNSPKSTLNSEIAAILGGSAHSKDNLKNNAPNKMSLVFYCELKYGYDFIKKALANNTEGEFNCLGKKLKYTTHLQFQ